MFWRINSLPKSETFNDVLKNFYLIWKLFQNNKNTLLINTLINGIIHANHSINIAFSFVHK